MRVVASELQFPEGPIALPDGDVLLVEIRRRTLSRVRPDGRVQVVADVGGGPNGAAMGPDGRCYIANNGGFAFAQHPDGRWRTTGPAADYKNGSIQRVDIETGRTELVYDRVGDEPLRGPNDLVFDAHGGFWFSDLGKIFPRTMDRGKVCYAKADGSFIREVIFPINRPNGVGLSPDGKTLFVSETDTARLWAFDLAGPGELARPCVSTPTSPHGGRLLYAASRFMRLDSLAVEANGNICVGSLDVGGISVCAPDGGLVEFVPIEGDTHCTNICFGGPDLRTAYVTQSWAGRLIAIDWPRAGLALSA